MLDGARGYGTGALIAESANVSCRMASTGKTGRTPLRRHDVGASQTKPGYCLFFCRVHRQWRAPYAICSLFSTTGTRDLSPYESSSLSVTHT